jgi:glycosyltransferase involved in cell wall biosynthesis
VSLVELVERDEDADVLVVTNMWPEPDRPVYGIFVKRQVDSLRAAGIRFDVLYVRGYASPLAYPAAALLCLRHALAWRRRYRLVHVHAGETSLPARFLLGVRTIVSYCGDDILGDPAADGSIPRKQRVRAAVIRAFAPTFTQTVTKSREMHDRLPAAARRRNLVVPNGVDTEVFRPLPQDEARARLGWEQDEAVALFAGTRPDSTRKRRWLAEAAVREASALLGRDVRLHVAGTVAPEEMPLLMNAASCLLHTSSMEGSPNVVKEALMCDLPVVATPSGDIAELLEGVEPSWLCGDDPAALAAALAECVRLGRRSNGHEAASRLAAPVVARRLTDLYAEVAG